MPTIVVELECPLCRRRIEVQVFPATAAGAAAGDSTEVYERCPKCGRTFPLLVPAHLA